MFQTVVIPTWARLAAYLVGFTWWASCKLADNYYGATHGHEPVFWQGFFADWTWAAPFLLLVAAGHVPQWNTKAKSSTMSASTTDTNAIQ